MRITTRFWKDKNLKTIGAGVAVTLGVAAFLMTGTSRFGGGADGFAAKVGNQTISLYELQERMQARGGARSTDEQRALIESSLDELVRQSLVVEEAERMGWGATDFEIRAYKESYPAFRDPTTGRYDKSLYEQAVTSGRVNELEFRKRAVQEITTGKLNALFILPAHVPSQLASEQWKMNNTSFELEYVVLESNSARQKELIQKEAAAWAADPSHEESLKKEYERSAAEFSHGAQIRFKTILVSFDKANRAQGEALKRTEADAQKLAEGLLGKLKAGEEFAKLASQFNDDPAAKAAGGDIGWMDEKRVDPDTWAAAKALNAKAPLSGVVKTAFGFRVLHWVEDRPASSVDFEKAKLTLSERAVATRVMAEDAKTLEAEVAPLLKGDATALQAWLGKNTLAWKALSAPVKPSEQFVKELGISDALRPWLFSLHKTGDMVPEVLPFGTRKVLIRLKSRKDPASAELKDVAALQAEAANDSTRSFYMQSIARLVESYTRKKDIVKNTTLLQKD